MVPRHDGTTGAVVKLAYILNTYPQPSHSFIRRELAAIEAQGTQVLRLAMRRSDLPLIDPADQEEAARTGYVLDTRAPGLIAGLVRGFAGQPALFLGALRLAWRMGGASQVGRLRHLIYLAEACLVARACHEAGIDHMHAHFGTNAATVACLAHALGGPGYSFTVHGPEEFDAPRALSLPRKIADAVFTVGVSSYGRSQLCRWADARDWPRLHVVHCGIEPERFADATPVPDGPVRLVCIGRFSEQKGHMVLIAAM